MDGSIFRFEAAHPETGEFLEAEAAYYPARRGAREVGNGGFGAPLEPDEEEEIVIRRLWNEAGEAVSFASLSGFEEELIEHGFCVVRQRLGSPDRGRGQSRSLR